MTGDGGSGGGGWFALLPAAERAALQGRGTLRRYRPGSTLFCEGDLSAFVLVLTEGRAKVSMTTPDGKDVVLAVCTPGEVLGEVSAIDGSPRSATASAIDLVEARVVAAEDFRAFLAVSAPAALALLVSVCGRLRTEDRRRVEFVALESVGRVARRLVELAEQFGVPCPDGGVRIDVPITQEDLAGWTGSSREAVGKALQALRRRGWIATGRRQITVADLEALRARAS
jgi:CRP/FNR family transcriptional regulator, cyclic AMP receptor protein